MIANLASAGTAWAADDGVEPDPLAELGGGILGSALGDGPAGGSTWTMLSVRGPAWSNITPAGSAPIAIGEMAIASRVVAVADATQVLGTPPSLGVDTGCITRQLALATQPSTAAGSRAGPACIWKIPGSHIEDVPIYWAGVLTKGLSSGSRSARI
jgi:hypothetical protein